MVDCLVIRATKIRNFLPILLAHRLNLISKKRRIAIRIHYVKYIRYVLS